MRYLTLAAAAAFAAMTTFASAEATGPMQLTETQLDGVTAAGGVRVTNRRHNRIAVGSVIRQSANATATSSVRGDCTGVCAPVATIGGVNTAIVLQSARITN